MILLWGLSGDPPLDAVGAALRRRRVPFTLLDQRRLGQTSFELVADEGGISGRIVIGSQSVRLEDVTAIYARPYDSTRLPAIERAGPDADLLSHAFLLDSAVLAWTDVAPALVVNRPGPSALNGSKPLQAHAIRGAGLETPETLITTDPRAAADFCSRHAAVVYKSISSVRSIVSRITPDHMRRLSNVTFCPTQFQEYVEGVDVRVHTVGDDVFACEVHSSADDYRYPEAGETPELKAVELPEDVRQRVVSMAKAMELTVAGADLRQTSDGRWYCFEVNPSPGFTYYEEGTGAPIADAVASLLSYAGR